MLINNSYIFKSCLIGDFGEEFQLIDLTKEDYDMSCSYDYCLLNESGYLIVW